MENYKQLSEFLQNLTGKSLPQAYEDFQIYGNVEIRENCNGYCTCGKTHLKYIYYIQHIPSCEVFPIGSSCIKRFEDDFDLESRLKYVNAYKNLSNMVNFVRSHQQEINRAHNKGKCVICNQPTIGKDTLKAKTNYFHYCSDCISINKRRRCHECHEFGHDINAELWRKKCIKCYYKN